MACSRFCSCDFSFWQVATVPVGTWVTRTAESVVFTLCPPGPEERYDVDPDVRRGRSRRRPPRPRGATSTPTAEVWTRPGGLGDRDPLHPVDARLAAASRRSRPRGRPRERGALDPAEVAEVASMTWVLQPRRSAQRSYIRTSSPANSADSVPPSPARTSTMASRSSSGSRGTSSRRSASAAAAAACSRPGSSSRRPTSWGASSRAVAQVVVGLLPRLVGRDDLAEHGVAAGQPAGQAGVARGRRGRRGRARPRRARRAAARTASNTSPPAGPAGRSRATVRHDDGARPRPRRGAGGRRDGCYLAASAGRASRPAWCRSASGSGRRGHRCRAASACPCRTGGTGCRRRR